MCGGCAHTVAVLFFLIHQLQMKPIPKILPRASLMEHQFLDCLKYKKTTQSKRKQQNPQLKPKRKYRRRKKNKNKHIDQDDDEPVSKRQQSSKNKSAKK